MIIIYDYEVFPCDVLLGTIILKDDGSKEYYQTWSKPEIKALFNEHKEDAIFVGWNSQAYDSIITDAIMHDEDPYAMSCSIVKSRFKPFTRFKYPDYDLMNAFGHPLSLKLTELIAGKSIETTEVPFNTPRPLTDEEKKKTETYNKADLDQTLYNFEKFKDQFELRLSIINEFNLPLIKYLNVTGTKLAAKVLGANKIEGIEYMKIPPFLYPELQLKNERLKRFFLDEEFRQGHSEVINIGGASINIGAGGLHQAIRRYHTEKLICYDISGAYNLIMINYNLLPRALSFEGMKLYEDMYHEQLRLKKINPLKRKVYKTILLSVFGAMNLPCSDFFDPQKGSLVTITGQLFVCDLLEKIAGKAKIVQVNTDGIMLEPNDWDKEGEIDNIVKEWCERTKFVTHKDYLYNFFQRDVNNYVCTDVDGKVINKGEIAKNYDISDKAYASGEIFNCTNPPIVALGIVNALIYAKTPEETVEENKNNLKLFQHVCKKNTFDFTALEITDNKGKLIDSVRLQGVDRAFASNDNSKIGMVYKYKSRNGKTNKTKIANLPMNVFVYDGDLSDLSVTKRIDYQVYIDRIYERLEEFVEEDENISLL